MKLSHLKGIGVCLALLSLCGCNKKETPLPAIDPQQVILGKWELIKNTFGSVSGRGSYQEFRKDSVLLNYVSKDDFSFSKYWIADSLLYIEHTYIDHSSGDTLFVDTQPYQFKFLNHDKLWTYSIYLSMNPSSTFKRIK